MRSLARKWLLLVSIGIGTFAGFAGLAEADSAISAPAGSGPMVDLNRNVNDPTDGATASVAASASDGSTTVVLEIEGLDTSAAGTTLGAHLHVGPCQLGDGAAAGPHYNISTADPKVVSNQTEVWLDFTIGVDGSARSSATVPFEIAPGATQSLVVHAMSTDNTGAAGARLACLRMTSPVASTPNGSGALVDLQPGSGAPTDGAMAQVATGTFRDETTVVLSIQGLDTAAAGTTLGAHLHVGPCKAGDGAVAGPHYNHSTAEPKVVNDQSEVWLDFTIGADGTAESVARVPFSIPEGGSQSLVIHAMSTDHTGAAGARLACLSLTGSAEPAPSLAPITPPSTGNAGLVDDASGSKVAALGLIALLVVGTSLMVSRTRSSE